MWAVLPCHIAYHWSGKLQAFLSLLRELELLNRQISSVFIAFLAHCECSCSIIRITFFSTPFRIGAAVAAAFFELFSGNSVVLAILGAIYSIPCFYYIITTPTLASPARFNLLTYNLICLYWCVLSHSFCQPQSDQCLPPVIISGNSISLW